MGLNIIIRKRERRKEKEERCVVGPEQRKLLEQQRASRTWRLSLIFPEGAASSPRLWPSSCSGDGSYVTLKACTQTPLYAQARRYSVSQSRLPRA